MTTDELKRSVLKLAFTGLLSDSFSYEKNDTLELIKDAIKQKAADNQERKKDAVLIKADEIDFSFPERWTITTLGSLCNIYNGDSINADVKKAKYMKKVDGWNYISTKDVGFDSNIDYNNGVIIPFDDLSFKVAKKNSVLICMEGGSAGKKIGILYQDVCFGNKLCCFYTYGIIPEYLFFFLQSPLFRSQFYDSVSGLIGGVGTAKLKKMFVPVPSIEEQKYIVERIRSLLPIIQRFGEAKDELDKLNDTIIDIFMKSIIQAAFKGLLTNKNEDVNNDGPFNIPSSWKWMKFDEAFDINPRNNISDSLEVSFVPMALANGRYENSFSYEKKLWKNVKSGFTHFANGDICFAKITPCFQNRKSFIASDLLNGYGAGTTEFHVLRFKNKLFFDKYVLWYLKSPYFIRYGMDCFSGAVGQQRFGTDSVRECLIPVPPIETQKAIADKIDEAYSLMLKHIE